jgi:kynurenine formamidase
MTPRRKFLQSSLLAAGWFSFRSTVPRAWAQTKTEIPVIRNDEDVDRILPSLTNWGRWGPEDQLGTLNFITAERRQAAVRSIRSARMVSLARERSVADPTGQRKFRYEMFRYLDAQPEESGCIDEIGMIYHGFNVTHLDALCHLFTPEGRNGMYNGFSTDAVTDKGAEKLGVEVMGRMGIVGRGVLLDIAALKGGPLPVGSAIMPGDLEAAEAAQNVSLGEGDILFVRNGAGTANTYARGTGLHAACLPWLHQRRIALLSSDSDSDVHPPLPEFRRWSEPVHMIAIPYMGMPLLCIAGLDEISAACAAEGRWHFFVSIAPWRFKGATSSPVNPLAIF